MSRNPVRIPAMGRAAACSAVISLAGTLLGALAAPPLLAQPPETEYRGAAALGLALRRLGNTARVLVIAAHPDDENTPLLSALALERGADVAYLSLTRGEGGQNAIGPELQEALGILRTEELLAARRLDGPAQFFTRAYDFGFSKSAKEVFRHWPRDTILGDVVRIVRAFRPDIVVSIFSGTPRDGHGQHQAAGILAHEAFAAAGDPARFPEQLAEGLLPHAPRKLYQAPWRGADRPTVRVSTGELDPLLGRSPFQIAMASRSRHRSQEMGQLERPGPASLVLVRVGPDGTPLQGEETSPFAGIDTTLAQRAATLGAAGVARLLAEYDAVVRAVRGGLDALRPARLVPGLSRASALLARADSLLAARPRGDAAAHTLRFHIAREAEDLNLALALASGLVLDAVADDGRVVPGRTFRLELTVWNGGEAPARVQALVPELPEGWSARLLETCAPAAAAPSRAGAPDCPPGTLGDPLAPGALLIQRYEVSVPATAPVTEPYYLRRPRGGDVYRWPADPGLAGLPFEPAPVHGRAEIEVAGARVVLHREAMHRFVDGTRGEVRRPVMVVPAVSVTLEPGVAILPLGGGTADTPAGNGAGTGSGSRAAEAPGGSTPGRDGPATHAAADAEPGSGAPSPAAPGPGLSFRVRLTAEAPDGIAGTLRLVLPAGWRAVPEAVPVRFAGTGETQVVEIAAHPPAGIPAGDYPVQAVFEAEDGRRYTRGLQLVDYPHIRPRPLYHEARASVRAFDVRVPAGLRVGYIAGPGDAVPQALAQLGVAIDLLDAAALSGAGAPGATADAAERTGAAPTAQAAGLARYDVIVVGSRAYESRPDLAANNARLLDYVREGGTLIVQYNQYEWSDGGYAPYPLSIARPHDRVTDETAPVRLLDPTHPALNHPNRITDADFEGWVQERGLYFPRTWDERYTPLLEMADPGEEGKRGALLVATVGRGTYVYTGLAFFRQLPAGVPGAYRLFANLLALGERRAP
ncbi:MAG TPA: PIG-L family deacetylase [Longimicrobiales bacterium]